MEAQRPSKKQRELLSFIDGFIKGHGYGPSYREIMRALNYSSVSTVAIHVNNLIKKGQLKKRDRSARSLEVVTASGGNNATMSQTVTLAQSKWLIELVNAKFTQVEEQPSAKMIDQLYVLVGALHVLGLDEAHVASRSRLAALEKEVSS